MSKDATKKGITEAADAQAKFAALEQQLGYCFQDKAMLEQALTHRSVLSRSHSTHYERLEFLGDAVLDLAIAHLLLNSHPELEEGQLSKMRAALVNTQALADKALELDLQRYIRVSPAERANGGVKRPSLLADVFEALFGAIYKEASFSVALGCAERLFVEQAKNVSPSDPKTELQEILHAKGKNPPTYLLEQVEGPEHEPTFVTTVEVNGTVMGQGRGPTKKASQQDAAAKALSEIENNKKAGGHNG